MVANIRFLYDNAADRATITASTTSGTLVAANLKADERAAVWRSTANTTQTLLLEWTAAENISAVCMAWTNLTALATVQIKGFTTPADYPASPIFTETFSPDSALALGEFVFGVDPLVESGAARARISSQMQCWLSATFSVRKLLITIADTTNILAYIEASRLIAGAKISPVRNMGQSGFNFGWVEQMAPQRAESRDLRVDSLGRYRKLELNLNQLEATSRNAVLGMVANGLGRGVWVSGMPEDAEASNRQLYGFYGALVKDTNFSYPLLDTWEAPLVFEEMA